MSVALVSGTCRVDKGSATHDVSHCEVNFPMVWIRVRSNVGRSSKGSGPLPAHSGLYIYNEPTNHLDTESIDALADALVEFSGGVVAVSHNSRLVSHVCEDQEKSEIWEVDNGRVERFDGSYEEYEENLMKEIRVEVEWSNIYRQGIPTALWGRSRRSLIYKGAAA
ncbi:ABC transporter F family member 4-like protein [Tanacetum coccineum]